MNTLNQYIDPMSDTMDWLFYTTSASQEILELYNKRYIVSNDNIPDNDTIQVHDTAVADTAVAAQLLL